MRNCASENPYPLWRCLMMSLNTGAMDSGQPLRGFRNDGRHGFAFQRHGAPEFCINIRPKNQRAQAIPRGTQRDPQVRAREMPGAWCTRSPCAKGSKHTVVTTGPPEHPAFPAQWFYGLLQALPGDRAFLPPSPPGRLPRRLDASVGASGPHDFAVRLSAVRQKRLRVHRIPPQRS